MTTVLIAGGGTGGHVFPMLAVGQAIRCLEASARVVYVGTPRGVEGRAIGETGNELFLLDVAPLRGDGIKGFVSGLVKAAKVLPEARALVQRLMPDVVLSVGGYAGGPIALAARFAGVPVTMLEPNSVLGLSNQLLTPFVARAYVAFPEVAKFMRPSIVRHVGVPLRTTFTPSPYVPEPRPVRLLVVGGSQGAQRLNEEVPRAVADAVAHGADLAVLHQAGRGRDDSVRHLYAELGLADRVRVVPFVDDVASELVAADVVVGRAGASSLAELCGVGRAAILVPYPYAADNHQYRNAISLERAGAAVAVAQADATSARLSREIQRLCFDSELRTRMARASLSLGRPTAARTVAEDLLALALERSMGADRMREAS